MTEEKRYTSAACRDTIELRSYAKINLSLEIFGRRSDGYHNIRSLMQGIDLYDVIKITKCPQNGTKYNLPHCTIDGVVVYLCTDAKTIPVDKSNLVFKGVKAVLDTVTGKADCDPKAGDASAELPASLLIELDKRLLVAAGMAGGSGNAAVCMLGVNNLIGNPLSLRELMDCGVKAGADVPFSIMMNAKRNAGELDGLRGLEEASVAAWTGGIGEVITPVEPMRRKIIMINPGIAVLTREAYEAIDVIHESKPAEDITSYEGPLFVNVLEEYTLGNYPAAAELKSYMQEKLNSDHVLMSGSGPTMVAYYSDYEKAQSDYEQVAEMARGMEGWKTWLTETGKE